MEQARLQLQSMLIANANGAALLTTLLTKPGSESDEYAPVKIDIVQDNEIVQAEAEQVIQICAKNDQPAIAVSPEYVHFYASCLLRIADKTLAGMNKTDTNFQVLRQQRRLLHVMREQMIEKNTGLVAFVACKYKSSHLCFEDLMQEGIVGLIKAVDRFDASRGISFSTYAVFWIKQAVSRLILKQEKVVRLPVALAEKASGVFEAMRHCYLENNRWPSVTELKNHCGLSIEEIKTISNYYQSTHSLDAALSDDTDDLCLLDKLQQHQYALPLDALIDQNLNHYIEQLLTDLPEKEATIITMRFGLRNHTEMTLQAIADQLHLTRERVRQIQNQALQKLKQQFGYDLMPFLEPNDI